MFVIWLSYRAGILFISTLFMTSHDKTGVYVKLLSVRLVFGIRPIQQKQLVKKPRDLTRDWTQIACIAVRHLNHYTKLFSVLVWGCNWIPFMHGWFCPIRLIHLIGCKSLHFEKTRLTSIHDCHSENIKRWLYLSVSTNNPQMVGHFSISMFYCLYFRTSVCPSIFLMLISYLFSSC